MPYNQTCSPNIVSHPLQPHRQRLQNRARTQTLMSERITIHLAAICSTPKISHAGSVTHHGKKILKHNACTTRNLQNKGWKHARKHSSIGHHSKTNHNKPNPAALTTSKSGSCICFQDGQNENNVPQTAHAAMKLCTHSSTAWQSCSSSGQNVLPKSTQVCYALAIHELLFVHSERSSTPP